MISNFFKSIFLTLLFCVFFTNCSQINNENIEKGEQKIIVVKIPPERDEKLSREERFWQTQKFLFPQIEIPKPIPNGVPHDDSLLYISLKENGSIKINNQESGNLSEIEVLQNKLTEIFRDRTKENVFEPLSDKIVKAVLITAPNSSKYEDVFKVIEAAEKAGAEPIVLRIGQFPIEVSVKADEQ